MKVQYCSIDSTYSSCAFFRKVSLDDVLVFGCKSCFIVELELDLDFFVTLFVTLFFSCGRPHDRFKASIGFIPSQSHRHLLHADQHFLHDPTLQEHFPMFLPHNIIFVP